MGLPPTHTAVQMIFEVSFFCRDEDLDMRYCEGLAQLKPRDTWGGVATRVFLQAPIVAVRIAWV